MVNLFRRGPRLLLDDAIAQVENENSFEGIVVIVSSEFSNK